MLSNNPGSLARRLSCARSASQTDGRGLLARTRLCLRSGPSGAFWRTGLLGSKGRMALCRPRPAKRRHPVRWGVAALGWVGE